jgi:hypothetical protein
MKIILKIVSEPEIQSEPLKTELKRIVNLPHKLLNFHAYKKYNL